MGGSGKTGWDWVIWAFKKARIYFPHSKLLINENSILSDSKITQNYIAIIDTLKSRGLIDGIGCQGHSLENVDTSIIRTNLNSLASTGLPIYISEYEVIASDAAAQLEIYKKQFPLFWTYPDIKGITFWGYIEYQMWSKYAYLLTFLLEEQPAMAWISNYLDSYLKVSLISPADSAGTPRNPVLVWHTSTGAELYDVQVAYDTGFNSIMTDTTVIDTVLKLPALDANTVYYWHVRASNISEIGRYSATAEFTTGDQILTADGRENTPITFYLFQNYPNPFNPSTTISYELPSQCEVILKVYDILGNEVATLVNKVQEAGYYSVVFNTQQIKSSNRLSSGIYIYRLEAGQYISTKKFLLLK